jgi:hypothetical protein
LPTIKTTIWSAVIIFAAFIGLGIVRDWFLLRYFSGSGTFMVGLFLCTALWPLAIWELAYVFLKLRRRLMP